MNRVSAPHQNTEAPHAAAGTAAPRVDHAVGMGSIPRKLHDLPLVAALRLASVLLGLVLGLAALRPALALFEAGNRAIGIVWLVSGVLLAGIVIAINERMVSVVRTKSRGGMRLAQAYLWVKGAVGIAVAFKFEGIPSVLGWVLVASALSAWLLLRGIRGRIPD